MSDTGQGDAIGEISKDDEGNISSTTCDSGGIEHNLCEPSKNDELTNDDQASKPENAEVLDQQTSYSIDTSPMEPQVTNLHGAECTVEAQAESSDHVNVSEVTASSSSSESKPKIDIMNDNFVDAGTVSEVPIDNIEFVDKPESSQTDVSSSSLDDKLKLRWEEEDECEASSDDILNLLDQEIGEPVTAIVKDKSENVESDVKAMDSIETKNELDCVEVIPSSCKEQSKEPNNDADYVEMSSFSDKNVEMDVDSENLNENVNEPINTVYEKLVTSISISDCHVDLNSEYTTLVSDKNSESVSEVTKERDMISSRPKELPVEETSEQSIANSTTDIHLEELEATSSNTNLNVHNKNELTSKNSIAKIGPTQVTTNISEPAEVGCDNQITTSPELAISVNLQDAEKEKRDIENPDISQLLDDDSMLDSSICPNVHHRLTKPNAMLDIPTQELSDIENELDSDDSYNEANESRHKSQENIKMDISVKEMSSGDVIKHKAKSDIKTHPMPLKNQASDEISDIEMVEIKENEVLTEVNATVKEESVAEIEISAKSNLNVTPLEKSTQDDIGAYLVEHMNSLDKLDVAAHIDKANKPSSQINIVGAESPSTSDAAQKTDDVLSVVSKSAQDDSNTDISTVKMQVDEPASKFIQNTDDVKLDNTKSDIDLEHSKAKIQGINESTTESTENGVSSTSTVKEVTDDAKPSSSKMNDDEKPSTSKSDDILTSDLAEVHEVTDSLGLLAESSRVMDDDEEGDEDDEPEEPEPCDDDDEDFDPYDETSSMMVAEQDDTFSPPPELEPKDLEPPSRQESDEGTMDIADDIECVENELPEIEMAGEDSSETTAHEKEHKVDEPEVIDADSHKETSDSPPQKIISILEKVLAQHQVTGPQVQTLLPAVNVLSYVDIGDGSSDSDDVLMVSKPEVSVNIPGDVEVMATSGGGVTSEIITKRGEFIISGIPKPAAPKMPKINVSEVTVSTVKPSAALHTPEVTTIPSKCNDEIFNVDSDEEEPPKESPPEIEETAEDKPKKSPKAARGCVNPGCAHHRGSSAQYCAVDRATAAYYSLKNRGLVCLQCRERAHHRGQALIDGIKDLRPLLELEMDAPSQQLVEISDSDSDDDAADDTEVIGEHGAKFLEDHLTDILNETWIKYKLESRLKEAENSLLSEIEKMEANANDLNSIFNEFQKKTDSSRLDFYGTFQPRRKVLGAIIINDTPISSYCCMERIPSEPKNTQTSNTEKELEETVLPVSRYPKRRAAAAPVEPPAKKPAIPMGYTPLGIEKEGTQMEIATDPGKGDDDNDVSVVNLSAEAAPEDLPPCGDAVKPPLRLGMVTYAMRNAYGAWLKGRVVELLPKCKETTPVQRTTPPSEFTQCKVKFEHKVKNPCKVLAARCLSYPEPSEVRMTIGTRVIALFKDPHNATRRESFYSGVIAEVPNPVNNYRYLVFFDDGYAQYVHHRDTRLVCESSPRVHEEVHPFIRDFVYNYLQSYPERPMVRLHTGERLKTEWNGQWWDSKVLQVDASIALIHFDEDNRTEWIYRGSTRLAPLYLELQAAEKAGERHRTRLPRSKAQIRSNMPCVEYTRSDEQAPTEADAATQQSEEQRRQRAVAKKSTTQAPSAVQGTPVEGLISRVVYYTPKNAIKPYKLVPHTCSPKCKRTDVLSLKELRTYNPLAKPLLSGWERQTVRYKGHKGVMYRAPCGRRVRGVRELHRYLRAVGSELAVDLFDFTPGTHCLAEFVLTKCLVGKKDLSHGKENVPVPCVNYYDDSLPEFCSYNTERTPTAGVPLNIDPEFLCGCDCTDDCEDKSKCACWKMTLEGARTIGLDSPDVGYVYRRLPEPLPSGIYECNSRCKCKQTCLNRVAQHPLQLKLQVFKTKNRGWGIRALNDIPKGSFLCVYAGNLLTDATANLDGLNEGDEYLAELDYIEVVEAMKEGYEEDIPEEDKVLDKMSSRGRSDAESEGAQTESEGETQPAERDDDFQPGYVPETSVKFQKSLRKRERKKKKEEIGKENQNAKSQDCITISDDEEVREPSRFTAQADMVDKAFKSKNSSRVSVRALFGKDEACYIMDAKVQGNIGRYLNHSCHPNVFVQNVFVDTHDPRFPWVAFFALWHVRAGTELTWNYNYDVGSVPGKVLYCYCGAPNCRGRLL